MSMPQGTSLPCPFCGLTLVAVYTLKFDYSKGAEEAVGYDHLGYVCTNQSCKRFFGKGVERAR